MVRPAGAVPRAKILLFLAACAAATAALVRTAGDVRTSDERREEPAEPPAVLRDWMGIPVPPRPPAREGADELAERLYGWNCMPCHGADGKGNGPVAVRLGLRPRDFTRGTFKLKTSVPGEMPFDEDLLRTIQCGFPQGAMPAFRDFTADELWALVDHVKSLSRGALDPFSAYPARTAIEGFEGSGDPVRGGRLFRDEVRCAQCHGERGRGDGPSAAGLVDSDGAPTPLTDFAWGKRAFKAGARPDDVFRVLTTGMEGTAMPSFRSLPARDRRDLAAFVAGLGRPVPPGEALYLDRGCSQCHTIGRGRRVGPDLAGLSARRSRDWLLRWLADPPTMLLRDEEARRLALDYPTPMPNLNLPPAEVERLVDFLLAWTPDGPR